MGILNLTPDSFSDGGKFNSKTKGIKQALKMFESGANIIDVGGESTKPGSKGINAKVEWNRVNKILRSENNNEKEYIVQVNRKITSDFLSNMSKGVKLKNINTKPCQTKKINNYTFKIILTQGLNRQIRRMCHLFDYKVKSLVRTRIININLGSLKLGRFRKFLPNELEGLNKILDKSL